MSRNEIVQADDGTLRPRPAGDEPSRRSSAGSSCARSATGPCRCRACRSTSAATSFPTTAAGCWRPTASRSRASTRSAGSSAARRASSARTSATPRRRWPGSPRTSPRARCPRPQSAGREEIDALLAERKPDLVTVEGWRAIEADELGTGRGAAAPAREAELTRGAAGGGPSRRLRRSRVSWLRLLPGRYRDRGVERRALAGRAGYAELAAERLDPVPQPDEARPSLGIRTPDPVVGDRQAHDAVVRACPYSRASTPGNASRRWSGPPTPRSRWPPRPAPEAAGPRRARGRPARTSGGRAISAPGRGRRARGSPGGCRARSPEAPRPRS